MKILLVEDDEFKASDIAKALAEVLRPTDVMRAVSVTSALRMITADTFDLLVLDMSLPTFDMSGPGGGGSPQGQGGLEVLRLARRIAARPYTIIVTQYPDIEIDGRDIPLSAAPKVLRARFDLNVLSCIHYEFDGDSWRSILRDSLVRFINLIQARDQSEK